jgi:hypothetical protein
MDQGLQNEISLSNVDWDVPLKFRQEVGKQQLLRYLSTPNGLGKPLCEKYSPALLNRPLRVQPP